MGKKDKALRAEILQCLNRIYSEEMAGINRYLHYSFMIMGYNRIPIQKWFRDQANESMGHALVVGEKITSLGGHPTHKVGELPETRTHRIDDILRESLTFEEKGLELYKDLVHLAEEAEDIALEELGREMVRHETEHLEEVAKMLRSNK
ncbi:MAG: ferritin-like domain-containing protein [Candidatus Binatia bacterium]